MQDREAERVQIDKQEKIRTRTTATIRIKAPVIMCVQWRREGQK